mmetsp:Transcript_7066/g.21533  ORF Transcript_7066/g.21533 Transcript_7066/m.21533 type:complete len:282 (-) Transcript_7066:2960-3805(-)
MCWRPRRSDAWMRRRSWRVPSEPPWPSRRSCRRSSRRSSGSWPRERARRPKRRHAPRGSDACWSSGSGRRRRRQRRADRWQRERARLPRPHAAWRRACGGPRRSALPPSCCGASRPRRRRSRSASGRRRRRASERTRPSCRRNSARWRRSESGWRRSAGGWRSSVARWSASASVCVVRPRSAALSIAPSSSASPASSSWALRRCCTRSSGAVPWQPVSGVGRSLPTRCNSSLNSLSRRNRSGAHTVGWCAVRRCYRRRWWCRRTPGSRHAPPRRWRACWTC